jgi:hypothetical protein
VYNLADLCFTRSAIGTDIFCGLALDYFTAALVILLRSGSAGLSNQMAVVLAGLKRTTWQSVWAHLSSYSFHNSVFGVSGCMCCGCVCIALGGEAGPASIATVFSWLSCSCVAVCW